MQKLEQKTDLKHSNLRKRHLNRKSIKLFFFCKLSIFIITRQEYCPQTIDLRSSQEKRSLKANLWPVKRLCHLSILDLITADEMSNALVKPEWNEHHL